jgi:hypothetical protein
MKNAAAGIALALAAAFGGQFIGNSFCSAIDAPRKRFDVAANAAIEQFRRESAERVARESAEDSLRLAPLRAALGATLSMADYDRLTIGMPAAFVHAALAPFTGQELAQVNGITSYLYSDGPRSIIVTFRDGRLAGKLQGGL